MEGEMNTNQARNWQQYTQPTPSDKQQKKIVVKVRNKSWLTKGEKVIYGFLSILILLGGIYIVNFSSTTDQLNRNVQSMEEKVQQQKVENEGLIFEVRELSKPERITKIAKENGLKIQETKVKRAAN